MWNAFAIAIVRNAFGEKQARQNVQTKLSHYALSKVSFFKKKTSDQVQNQLTSTF